MKLFKWIYQISLLVLVLYNTWAILKLNIAVNTIVRFLISNLQIR